MSKITNKIIDTLGSVLKRKILLVSPEETPYIHAVKSRSGFWYCGNLYDTSDIAYGIARNGEVEKEETEVVQNILKQLPQDFTLFDIGANTGYYGIMSSYLFPTSKVQSFEPMKYHCDLIRESIKLNNLSNIEVNECALGEKTERKNIYTAGSGTTLVKGFTEKTQTEVEIEVKKLDEVVKEKNIQTIDFIKIDVEGFELKVLKGATESIKSFKPVLFVEICYTKDGSKGLYKNENFLETVELLENLGYKTKILKPEGLQDFNKNTLPPKGVWMFLFTHKETHSHINL